MENNQQQILSEIKSLMTSVRLQLEELDAKIAQWQQCVEPEEIDMASVIDLQLEDEMLVHVEPVSEEPVSEEPVSEEFVSEEPVSEEPVSEELVSEDMPSDDDDLPFFDVPDEPAVEKVAPVRQMEDKPAERTAVVDMLTRRHAWRTAMPGTPVKDIRGAIALMDRVLFINTLFGTDPMAFQETLTLLNQMQSLDQAVEYLALAHPEWDFDSDVVYSFMMAVRRKVNA